MVKKSRKFPIFVITLFIGLGLIAIAFVQPAFIFGDSGRIALDISDVTGLTLIDVPIDPTGGQILGTVKFGAPIVVPFERSGTILSADGGCVTAKDPTNLALGSEVKFGRIGSGDRNAEVSFHNFNGVNCGYGYAEWDLTDLPNDFVATGFTLQLNLKSIQSGSSACYIGFVTDTFDEIGERSIANRMLWGSEQGGSSSTQIKTTLGGATPTDPDGNRLAHDFLAVGQFVSNQPKYATDWCETTGTKRWTFSKIEATGFRVLADGTVTNSPTGARLRPDIGVESFNNQVQFNPITQLGNDKFMLVFYGGSIRGGASPNVIDHQWWEENGSLLVTGSSQPIRCGIGFNQVDFRCIPIECQTGEKVDANTNECTPIICEEGNELQENICVPIQCNIGEELIGSTCTTITCEEGTHLVGSTCDPLFCGEGFEITGNECTVIPCPSGQELIGDQCQGIVCPDNTRLIGNDCKEITCGVGQIAVNNVCQDENTVGTPNCEAGFEAIGNVCTPIILDCPAGTEEFENNCRNIVPSLLQISGTDPTLFLIVGIVITGMSGVGIVARRRA